LSAVAQCKVLLRDDTQLLGDVLPDPLQCITATGALSLILLQVVYDVDPFQLWRYGP
jgi:hypothetical protein